MKPASQSISYLVHNTYSYCFRMNVPRDLQEYTGKKELRYRLKTGYIGQAKYKARILAGSVQQLFRFLRRECSKVNELTLEKIREIVKNYLYKIVEDMENYDHIDDPNYYNPIYDYTEVKWQVDTWQHHKEELLWYLTQENFEHVKDIVDELLSENGIKDINKSSKAKLCDAILKVQMKECDFYLKRYEGDFSWKNELPQTINEICPGIPDHIQQTLSNQTERKSYILSEIIDKYVDENKISWTGKTKDEYLTSLNLFREVTKDIPIKTIDRPKLREFKETLMKLPPNRKKNPKYRDKSIEEILKMNVTKTLSRTTVDKQLTRVGTLFNYAIINGFYDGPNPVTGMSPPKVKQDLESTAPYTNDELKKILNSEDYMKDTHDQPFKFWIPLLALFTGARQNELAQLHLSDIKESEDGVWIIDINADGEKRLKTKSSKRIIPIHDFLLKDLKLIAYVDQLNDKGEERL